MVGLVVGLFGVVVIVILLLAVDALLVWWLIRVLEFDFVVMIAYSGCLWC